MIRKWQLSGLIIITLFSLNTLTYAKTVDEYLDDVYKLIDQKKYDEALTLVQKVADEYPGEWGPTIAFAEILYFKGDYETAIANYMNIMKALASSGKEVPAMAHYHSILADAYNELGQRHYFSKDLCLRIIYHTEKMFELMPETLQDGNNIEFVRKSIGHYDVSSIGAKIKMMEEGGDGKDFQLPNDYVSNDEKMRYLDKAIQRIKDYDISKKEIAFQTTTSDKTLEDIMALINQRVSAINFIHFRRMNKHNVLLEEIFFKSPDKIKVVASDAITVLNGTTYTVIDPKDNTKMHEDTIAPGQWSLLRGIGFYNLNESSRDYNLTIEKIVDCPVFLSEVCIGASISLYLITGKLKNPDGGPYYPPTPKIEYFIDGQSGLCVAKREYWLGIMGSGKEEELAKETIVTHIEQTKEGISFASAGMTKGHVNELAGLNEDWEINVLSINQDINDQEFVVTATEGTKKKVELPLVFSLDELTPEQKEYFQKNY